MASGMGSYRMLKFPDMPWSELTRRSESPWVACLKSSVPVFLKVDRTIQLVYRRHEVAMVETTSKDLDPAWDKLWKFPDGKVPVSGALPFVGFDEEIIFLRIPIDALAEIAVSGECTVGTFSGGGLAMPRSYTETGKDRGGNSVGAYGDVINPQLVPVNFTEALVVDRHAWSRQKPAAALILGLEDFARLIRVREEDVYFSSDGLQLLKERVRLDREVIDYPYEHRSEMPGLYWMFQAAFVHNQLGKISKKEVKKWLTEQAPAKTFRYHTIRTAEKFVWMNLDRARGGENHGEADLDRLDDRGRYEFSFVSHWFSLILAIAEWWAQLKRESPTEPLSSLARRLRDWRFNGLEVEDLVWLIGRDKLSDD